MRSHVSGVDGVLSSLATASKSGFTSETLRIARRSLVFASPVKVDS